MDAEERSFFLAGDAGTYAGGPAESIAPVALEGPIIHEDPAGLAPPPEVLRRRRRWQRLVGSVVATLATSCLALFSFQAGARQGERLAQTAAPSPGATAGIPVAAPPPPGEAPGDEPPAPAPPFSEEAAPPIAAPPIAAPPIAAPPIAAPPPPGPSPPSRQARSTARVARVLHASLAPARLDEPGSLSRAEPQAMVSLPPRPSAGVATRAHVPPTVSFPD